MSMNLAQLRYFQHLARVRHYTRAAAGLYITQPTLSHAMATLSEELGCELFHKSGRELVLTAEGKAFLAHVDRALSELDAGVEEIVERQGMVAGTVEIGAVTSTRLLFVPAAIKAFREECSPYVDFDLFQGLTGSLSERFGEGLYDLLVVGPSVIPQTERKLLFYQELALAVRPDHPLASRPSAKIADLAGYDVVTYRPGKAVGELATKFLDDHQAPLDRMRLVRNCDDEETMGAQVIDDGMVALTIVCTNLPVNPNLTIVPLDEPGAREFYPIYVVYRKAGYVGPAAKEFIRFLCGFTPPVYRRPDYGSCVLKEQP